jgi:hypothetical protein
MEQTGSVSDFHNRNCPVELPHQRPLTSELHPTAATLISTTALEICSHRNIQVLSNQLIPDQKSQQSQRWHVNSSSEETSRCKWPIANDCGIVENTTEEEARKDEG